MAQLIIAEVTGDEPRLAFRKNMSPKNAPEMMASRHVLEGEAVEEEHDHAAQRHHDHEHLAGGRHAALLDGFIERHECHGAVLQHDRAAHARKLIGIGEGDAH